MGGSEGFPGFHRNEKGVLSAEDDAAYTRMEQEITESGEGDRPDGAAGSL